MASPDVSVVTALYNGERFIGETAKSILSQKGIAVQWIVVDDASVDKGLDVIRNVAASCPVGDVDLLLIRRDRNIGSSGGKYLQGIWEVYRQGVNAARAPFIKIIDHDDILAGPDSLKRQLAFMREHPVDLAFSRSVAIDENGRIIRNRGLFPCVNGVVSREQLILNYILHPGHPFRHVSMLFLRSTLDLLYPNQDYAFDTALFFDMIKNGRSIGYQDEVQAMYRKHGNNYSVVHPGALEDCISLKSQYAELFVKHQGVSALVRRYWLFIPRVGAIIRRHT